MRLLLICPHCQAKIPLSSRTCPGCRADLRDLARGERRYFIGRPGAPEAAPPVPEMVSYPFPEADEPELGELYPEPMMGATARLESKDVSLCEALDRVLNKGAVLFGEVMISVADIDLVYLGLQVILASMETAKGLRPLQEGQWGPNIFDKGAS
jgi:gas vesicle structural protein